MDDSTHHLCAGFQYKPIFNVSLLRLAHVQCDFFFPPRAWIIGDLIFSLQRLQTTKHICTFWKRFQTCGSEAGHGCSSLRASAQLQLRESHFPEGVWQQQGWPEGADPSQQGRQSSARGCCLPGCWGHSQPRPRSCSSANCADCNVVIPSSQLPAAPGRISVPQHLW